MSAWEVHCTMLGFVPIVEANSEEEAARMVKDRVEKAIATAAQETSDPVARDVLTIMELETEALPSGEEAGSFPNDDPAEAEGGMDIVIPDELEQLLLAIQQPGESLVDTIDRVAREVIAKRGRA